MDALAQSTYWASQVVLFASLTLIAYLTGTLAVRRGVKVNYTRKINHFVLFFLPVFLNDVLPYHSNAATTLASAGIFAIALFLLRRPVRERSPFVATVFASIDRPEDRPHTLLWLATQVAAGYAVLIPLGVLLHLQGVPELIYVPILVNGIGDGLAEPVGVRFGRHEYEVRSLTTDRTYTRTLEGSACVLLTGLVVVAFFRETFTPTQFWITLALVPPAVTLAEARAPHTWDTPFLFLVGGGLPLLVLVLL